MLLSIAGNLVGKIVWFIVGSAFASPFSCLEGWGGVCVWGGGVDESGESKQKEPHLRSELSCDLLLRTQQGSMHLSDLEHICAPGWSRRSPTTHRITMNYVRVSA